MIQKISDVRLVEAAITGDSKTFDELVKRYQRTVYATAFAIIADREAALDVLQESFIAAHRHLDSLDDGCRFGPWVCGIARNQAKRLRRAKFRNASRELPLQEAEVASQQSKPDVPAEHIRDALTALTPMQADVVTLFYMEGYSIAECANLLGVPQGTIKRRLHDARQRLKKEMADMVEKHLKDLALPEDYRVVIDKPTKIHTTHPALAYFRDQWVLLWQDGMPWEPYDGPWWYWISESRDGKSWSEPRRLELPTGRDAMRDYTNGLSLMNCCVLGDKLAFLTHQFAGHMDLYTSEDTINWDVHPRFRMGHISRGFLFSSEKDLYLTYPSQFMDAMAGYRIDLLRSSDGGLTWQWLNSPYWADGEVYDCAGAVVGNRIYMIWRENVGTWTVTEVPGRYLPDWNYSVAMHDPNVPEGELVQRVCLTWSDDGGQTWAHCPGHHHWVSKSSLSDPIRVRSMDVVKPYCSTMRLQIAAFKRTLVIAQSVGTGFDNNEIWVTFSRDGGLTWSEKAVYSPGMLRDAAVAFGPDGSIMIAGSSRVGNETRPWVIHSQVGT